MASKYADDTVSARQDITDEGLLCTFSRESSVYDPVTGGNTPVVTTFTGYAVKTRYKKNEIDGTSIKQGDSLLILEATTPAPIIGDKVTVTPNDTALSAIDYRVMDINPIDPDGSPIIHKVQIRV